MTKGLRARHFSTENRTARGPPPGLGEKVTSRFFQETFPEYPSYIGEREGAAPGGGRFYWRHNMRNKPVVHAMIAVFLALGEAIGGQPVLQRAGDYIRRLLADDIVDPDAASNTRNGAGRNRRRRTGDDNTSTRSATNPSPGSTG